MPTAHRHRALLTTLACLCAPAAAQTLEHATPWRVAGQHEFTASPGELSYAPNLFDYLGLSMGSIDVDGDGRRELLVGAPGLDGLGIDRGAMFLLFLRADGSLRSQVLIAEGLGGFFQPIDDSDYFGRGMDCIGDLDGDGVPDLAVGAYRDDDGGFDKGAVYILFMKPDGTVKTHQKISSLFGGFTGPVQQGDVFGIRVAGLGDLDGDGIEDVIVTASLTDDGGQDRGAAYVLFLNTDGTVQSYCKIGRGFGGFNVLLDDDDYFGCDVAAPGDIDGDGIQDVVVAAFGDDDGGPGTGAVYVLFLRNNGTVRAQRKISATTGDLVGELGSGDNFGSSLTSLGDVDGDGHPTIAVGAYRDDDGGTNRGAVWILKLASDGSVMQKRKISTTRGGFGGDIQDTENFGSSVTCLGDLDGNGVPDLGVGVWLAGTGGIPVGSAWVLRMGPPAAAAPPATMRLGF